MFPFEYNIQTQFDMNFRVFAPLLYQGVNPVVGAVAGSLGNLVAFHDIPPSSIRCYIDDVFDTCTCIHIRIHVCCFVTR